MAGIPWTEEENDKIVVDYFAMLADDLAGRHYNKAEHNRRLQHEIERSRSSIEYKHRNISAVLKVLGETWIKGYMPAENFQKPLVDSVLGWLDRNPEFSRPEFDHDVRKPKQADELKIMPPPTLSNQPPPKDHGKTLAFAQSAAARAERNRDLGRAGEKRALDHERAALIRAGRSDLAKRLRWVSEEEGDGAGYDIKSFTPTGHTRRIEVKTTNGGERTPFYISRNELAAAEKWRTEWSLFRLWNFVREPRAFELRPPIESHVALIAANFEARFD